MKPIFICMCVCPILCTRAFTSCLPKAIQGFCEVRWYQVLCGDEVSREREPEVPFIIPTSFQIGFLRRYKTTLYNRPFENEKVKMRVRHALTTLPLKALIPNVIN